MHNLGKGLFGWKPVFKKKKILFENFRSIQFLERWRERSGFSDAASLLCPFVLLAGRTKTKMAYSWLRWPILSASLTPLMTIQTAGRTTSQPSVPTITTQKEEVVTPAVCSETRREQRKRRNARKRIARREKKNKAIEEKIHEMASKAEPTMQELDDAAKQKLAKRAIRKQKITSRRAAKQQREMMAVENKINQEVIKTQANMQELVEAEKKRAERYLSLARKYYGMWKLLNEQQNSASKSREEDYKCNVRNLFSLCLM